MITYHLYILSISYVIGIIKHLLTFAQTFLLHIKLNLNYLITLCGHFCKLKTKGIGAEEQTISKLKFFFPPY